MDDCGRNYAYSYLKAKYNGKLDAESIQKLLRDTCGYSLNDQEVKLLLNRLTRTGSSELNEADFERVIQKGRTDIQGYSTLWNRIKDGDMQMSIDCLDDFVRKDMKIHGVTTDDIQGYMSYMGLADTTEIDYDAFRKM